MNDRITAELESADNKVIFGWTLLILGVIIGIFLFLTIGGYEWYTLNLESKFFEQNMPLITLIIIAFIFIGVFLVHLGTSERLRISERSYRGEERKIVVDNRERYVPYYPERRYPKKHFRKPKKVIKHKLKRKKRR